MTEMHRCPEKGCPVRFTADTPPDRRRCPIHAQEPDQVRGHVFLRRLDRARAELGGDA